MARTKAKTIEVESSVDIVEEANKEFDTPMVIEAMDANKVDWNIGYLVELMENRIVNFDAPVQRGYVWNNKKDSLLLRSIIRRIPISNFYFNKVGNTYEGLEGKQRSNAIFKFVKGEYKLHANTPSIIINDEVFPLARKKFEHLHNTIQNRILRYAIDGHWFDNMSVDEKVDFFILTNSGKPVTAAEISRIKIKSRDVFLELTEHPAVIDAITEKNRRKCMDEDILSQVWCLCFSGQSSLLQKDISPILASETVTEEQKNETVLALDYLSALYKEVAAKNKIMYTKMRKPTHIISLIYMGWLANKKGLDANFFVEKAMKFFNGEGRTVTISKVYNDAVVTGSAKPEQVKIRLNEIEKALVD